MTREADPTRKPLLLDQILEHLLDKPLASLSFRTLAKALDVSTFTLVYHFGSRAELLSQIVEAISSRQLEKGDELNYDARTVDAYFDGLEASWRWAIQPRNLQFQRLEFEAAMMEAQDPTQYTFTRSLHTHWLTAGRDALVGFGLSEEDAHAETRLLLAMFLGLRYDLMMNQDVPQTTLAFRRLIENHRVNLETLIAEAASVGSLR